MAKRKRKPRNGIQEQHAAGHEIVPPTPQFVARHTLEEVKTDLGSRTLRVRDKRPIDKYFRLYSVDAERGIAEAYRQGINEAQYRAADRLACNFERCVSRGTAAFDGMRVQSSVNVGAYPVESITNAIHFHRRILRDVSRVSCEIIEEICCRESNLLAFERGKGWRKGYGMIRFREALDELTESFRAYGSS